MAFVSPVVLQGSLHRGHLGYCARRPRSRPARWTSLAKSHPYGNGGVPSKPDYSNWDKERLMADIAEAEANFKPAEDSMGQWAIVMSADILQWNNNLFQASAEEGFKWDLAGVNVVPIHESIARRCIEVDVFDLWVLEMGNEGVLSFAMHDEGQAVDDGTEVLLTFSIEEEAQRFVDQLAADGKEAKVRLVPIKSLKELCKQDGMILGLVPAKTLVSPGQFNMTF